MSKLIFNFCLLLALGISNSNADDQKCKELIELEGQEAQSAIQDYLINHPNVYAVRSPRNSRAKRYFMTYKTVSNTGRFRLSAEQVFDLGVPVTSTFRACLPYR
jgi:hypothetical protein